MDSRTKQQTQRIARRQRSARQQVFMIVALGSIVVVLLFLFISNRDAGSDAPSRTQDRLELDPMLGNPDAPVTIIEYGAYACTACRAWHQAGIIEGILATYPGQVRFIFRDFPVIFPPYDYMAAQIAQCALDQSQQRFWAFHNALYTTATPQSSQADLLRVGEQIGLDGGVLRTCAESEIHRATVQYDEKRARNLGLPGTPSFLVNDIRIFNATPDVLQAAVEQTLRAEAGAGSVG